MNLSSLDEDLRLQTDSAQAWLWWTHVPSLAGERLGVIGQFHAASSQGAHAILTKACDELRTRGCSLAVGPMDGNTWRRYRLVTDPGDEPPFFLEPTNPPEWPQWWRESGFESLAEYYSTASDDVTTRDPRLEGVAHRMAAAGIAIRPIDLSRFEAELSCIHDVSVLSFQNNYLYTPLPRDAFVAQYRAVQACVRTELVLLAEQAGKPVGYVFAIPDRAQAQRGEPVTSFIVKTLAVLPGRAYAGLGALLLGRVHDAAHRLGFTRVIHALMHESNNSRNLSAHYAQTIRRYTLFQRRLAPAGAAS
jgi:GNAT superfamily N-acetyltransferase